MSAPPFLSHRPSPRVTAAVGWLFLAFAAIGVAFVLLVDLPETVSGRFLLVSNNALRPLIAQEEGRVGALTRQVGEQVSEGEVLLQLTSPHAARKEVERAMLAASTASEDTQIEDALFEARQRILIAEGTRLQERVAYLKHAIPFAEADQQWSGQELTAAQQLARDGAFSEHDVASLAQQHRNNTLTVEQLRAEQREQAAALEVVRQQQTALSLEHQLASAARERQVHRDEGLLSVLEQELHGQQEGIHALQITAPCTGELLAAPMAVGDWTSRSETLGVVRCDEGDLEVRVELPESTAGRVRPGQLVWLLFDAFPYQHYGACRGEVRWVGVGTDGFEARVTIAPESLQREDVTLSLLPGMAGSARVETARRPLVWQLVAPLRGLAELSR